MFFFILIVIQGIMIGALCSFVASQKNRGWLSWFILGFIFSIFALIALAAIPTIKEEPSDGYQKPASKNQEQFQGNSILSNDEYKIWLVHKYNIEKNTTLDGFICDNKIFATINDALDYADSKYNAENTQTPQSPKDTIIETGAYLGRNWIKYGDNSFETNMISGTPKRFDCFEDMIAFMKQY